MKMSAHNQDVISLREIHSICQVKWQMAVSKHDPVMVEGVSRAPHVVVVVVVIQFFIRCFPFSRDGRIYPIPSAISRTPSLHLSRLRASSFFKPIFSVSSSTCFFQVFFGRPHFLLPVTSRFRATLKTLSSSLLSTCPYHLTPFAVANWSIVSFNPNISICSSVAFLSTIF